MLSTFRLSLLAFLCLATLNAQSANDKLGWSRYLPAGGYDVATNVLVERSGDVWVAGYSYGKYEAYGPNEPFQLNNAGSSDIFLTKFRINPDGSSTVLFFTWLGGASTEELVDMKFDNRGRIVLCGITNSNNFPIAGNPIQNAAGGDYDVFVAIIDPNQGGKASLVYSTYYGTTGREQAKALAVSSENNIAVVGNTTADKLPGTSTGAQPNRRGNTDAFVIYFNPDQSATLKYASYLGGASTDTAVAVAIDRSNRIWFAGSTGSDDFPVTSNGAKISATGYLEGYVACFDPAISGLDSLIYSSLIGGSKSDEARGVAVDSNGKVWVTGITFSEDFPVTANAAQRTLGGGTDLFLVQIDPLLEGAAGLVYSTFLGGTGYEFAYGFTQIDATRFALAGYSMTGLLPTTANAYSKLPASGFAEGLVAVLNTALSGAPAVEYLSYFGGTSTDVINSVAFDPTNAKSLFIAGYSTSINLPTTDGTSRGNAPNAPNAFAAKLLR